VQPFQQLAKEALGGALVSVLLDKDIQHVSVLIHGPPQIVTLPSDGNEYLVQIPRVPWTPVAMTQLLGEGRPEFQAPLTDRFVADGYLPLGQQLFNIPEAETKTMVEPDSV
jgi:hypothetical protein